jgi:phosphoenolpyruvate-protein kinase (PTS system EI component)
MVPEIKRLIRAVNYEEARSFARGCLAMSTASEVREWAKSELDVRLWGFLDDTRPS